MPNRFPQKPITYAIAVSALTLSFVLSGAGNASAKLTKAPKPVERTKVKVETIARGLRNPWAIQELPDSRMIVTERPGRMRIVEKNGRVSRPLANVPNVAASGQGGLLDIALAPDFATSKTVFFTYSEPRDRGRSGTAVAKARLNTDGTRPSLSDVRVIFRQKPDMRSALHFGSRIAFARDGTLYVTLGDRYYARDKAQQPTNHLGKIIHITAEGSPAKARPAKPGWLPEIWSIGHRNAQGATIHPETGKLWTVEHGAQGGDEINIPDAGKNYGWPVITYGRDYSGAKIGIGIKKNGLEQPVYYWDPSIAPSGMTFYTSARYPKWKNSAFVGALAGTHLTRLVLSGNTVIAEEKFLESLDERIRDVRQARDGTLLVLTDSGNGRVLRLTPQP